MKKVLGTLLAGAAIIALSGCSSKPIEDSVDIEELHTGYEVVFERVEEADSTNIQYKLEEILDPEVTYTFCPWGSTFPSNAEINVAANSGKYKTTRLGEEGEFYIDGTDIDFRPWLNFEDATEVGSKSIQPLADINYFIETENGSLKVGGIYSIRGNDHEVLEIEKIDCVIKEDK